MAKEFIRNIKQSYDIQFLANTLRESLYTEKMYIERFNLFSFFFIDGSM